ncbi:MAG: dephospho-CoA kinase [Burkholderiales bacterium]|nr:dephospho-CoA kinase [Burkholderiales bacterium]
MTYLVGLTGGIGSGKSTVGARIAQLGGGLIDADAVSHALTRREAPGWQAIRAVFGAGYFTPDGELDRAKLRQAVFADAAAKTRLEGALHPLIRAETDRQVAAATAPYVMLMVPLLFESGRYRERCRRVLVVDCRESTQVSRVVARSGMAPGDVRAIMRSQMGRAERLALADDVIDNEGDPLLWSGAATRLDTLYRHLARG